MTSIFQRALGPDFGQLHPQLQRRFGFSAADGVACVGRGTMDRVWHGRIFTRPFLALGARRHILITGSGRDIPFTIENYAYRDGFGRETVTFARTFWFDTAQHWDATMIYSAERSAIVDYLGTHQHLAVDLHMTADEQGGLLIRSGEQRFSECGIGLAVPRLITAVAEVRESYDDDLDQFRIEVVVTNRVFGPLFGYRGTFTATYSELTQVPAWVRPVKETARA
ncbi:MAG TPA: DUF4166 domain-containing protein [Streptosporangiaceae bacterium]